MSCPASIPSMIPAIPFLQRASEPQVISLVSGVDDGDTTFTPDLGRLRPEFISIRDWLGSAPRQSILAAVARGSTSVLANPTPSTRQSVADPRQP